MEKQQRDGYPWGTPIDATGEYIFHDTSFDDYFSSSSNDHLDGFQPQAGFPMTTGEQHELQGLEMMLQEAPRPADSNSDFISNHSCPVGSMNLDIWDTVPMPVNAAIYTIPSPQPLWQDAFTSSTPGIITPDILTRNPNTIMTPLSPSPPLDLPSTAAWLSYDPMFSPGPFSDPVTPTTYFQLPFSQPVGPALSTAGSMLSTPGIVQQPSPPMSTAGTTQQPSPPVSTPGLSPSVKVNRTRESAREKNKRLKPIKCPFCPQGTAYKADVNKHIRAKHPDRAAEKGISTAKAVCDVCLKQFARRDHVLRHGQNHHGWPLGKKRTRGS